MGDPTNLAWSQAWDGVHMSNLRKYVKKYDSTDELPTPAQVENGSIANVNGVLYLLDDGVWGVLQIDTDSIANNAVTGGKVSDQSIPYSKLALFISSEQTGIGSSQNVAHGLGSTPTKVFVAPTELPADLAAGYDVAEGAHDATNVKVTVTTGVKFKVFAIL